MLTNGGPELGALPLRLAIWHAARFLSKQARPRLDREGWRKWSGGGGLVACPPRGRVDDDDDDDGGRRPRAYVEILLHPWAVERVAVKLVVAPLSRRVPGPGCTEAVKSPCRGRPRPLTRRHFEQKPASFQAAVFLSRHPCPPFHR